MSDALSLANNSANFLKSPSSRKANTLSKTRKLRTGRPIGQSSNRFFQAAPIGASSGTAWVAQGPAPTDFHFSHASVQGLAQDKDRGSKAFNPAVSPGPTVTPSKRAALSQTLQASALPDRTEVLSNHVQRTVAAPSLLSMRMVEPLSAASEAGKSGHSIGSALRSMRGGLKAFLSAPRLFKKRTVGLLDKSSQASELNGNIATVLQSLFLKLHQEAESPHSKALDAQFLLAKSGIYQEKHPQARPKGKFFTFMPEAVLSKEQALNPRYQAIDPTTLDPSESIYFENQIDGTCQTHVINNLVGFSLVTPSILRYLTAKVSGQQFQWGAEPYMNACNQTTLFREVAHWYRSQFTQLPPFVQKKLSGSFNEVIDKLEMKTLYCDETSKSEREAFKSFAKQAVENRNLNAFTVLVTTKEIGHIIALKRSQHNPERWIILDSNYKPVELSVEAFLTSLSADPAIKALQIGCPVGALRSFDRSSAAFWQSSKPSIRSSKDLRSKEQQLNEIGLFAKANFSESKQMGKTISRFQAGRQLIALAVESEGVEIWCRVENSHLRQAQLLNCVSGLNGFIAFYHRLSPSEEKSALREKFCQLTNNPNQFLDLNRFDEFYEKFKTMGIRHQTIIEEENAKKKALQQKQVALMRTNHQLSADPTLTPSKVTQMVENNKVNIEQLTQELRFLDSTPVKLVKEEIQLIENFFTGGEVTLPIEQFVSKLDQLLDGWVKVPDWLPLS